MEDLEVKGRIWIETSSGLKIGSGRARLLAHIEEYGSIVEAAKILNIPYRRAWGIIRDINNNASKIVVVKEVGGSEGGKSVLTDYGKKIVDLYQRAEESFIKFSTREGSHISRGQ